VPAEKIPKKRRDAAKEERREWKHRGRRVGVRTTA
jgi:hypothetical protein